MNVAHPFSQLAEITDLLMKFKATLILFICFFFSQAVFSQDLSQALDLKPNVSNLSPDDIIKKVETRYTVQGFSANFFQVSTIKAMKITDTAYGRAFFKRPDKMRWEYEKPDRQTIITDGSHDRQGPFFFRGRQRIQFSFRYKIDTEQIQCYSRKKS